MEKSSLRLQVSRLSCTASAAVRSISMSMAKTAARPRQPALPAQPARQAGRCWLSICRSTHPKNSPEKLVPWVVTRNCKRSMPGCSRCGNISECMGSASGRGLLCRRCRRKTGEGAACLPGGGYGKADPCPDAAGRGNGGAAARGRGDPHRTLGRRFRGRICAGCGSTRCTGSATQVLYADTDPLTGHTAMEQFRQQTRAHLTILEGGEHWFHTETQLAALQSWESCHL